MVFVTIMIITCQGYAAEPAGEYLKYQEPQPASSSWLSSIAYIISILITFAIVIGLAYYTSRFLGQKMGNVSVAGDQKILVTLALGPNRALHVVAIAGKYFIIGVTEHTINLLQEVTDPEQIEKLKAQPAVGAATPFDTIFQKQLTSLQQMTKKFPAVFDTHQGNEPQNEREKR